MKQETLWRLASSVIPPQRLLGNRLGDWYNANSYHKFNFEDILVLNSRNTLGYGVRPVALVKGFEIETFGRRKQGKYIVDMYEDYRADFIEWMRTGNVPEGVKRVVREEKHFKWNIENHFRRVLAKTPESALLNYAVS